VAKSDNMLSILWLLLHRGRMTAQQLADELEIHVRTVYRCIDSLCASGVPIIADAGHHGGYYLQENFAEAPLFFDLDEQKSLVHAAAFALDSGYPYADALRRAIDKLRHYATEAQAEAIDRHAEGVTVVQPPLDEQHRARLEVLEQAAAAGRTIEMTYDKGHHRTAEARSLDPYGLAYWKGSWYVAGYCHLRQQLRSFRIDRIVELQHTDRSFQKPRGFSAGQFLLHQLLPSASETNHLITVIVQAPDEVLNELSKHWLFGHALTERTPGQASFQLAEHTMRTYVPYFLLPYGRALTIREPILLMERMAEVAANMAEHYQSMAKGRDAT